MTARAKGQTRIDRVSSRNGYLRVLARCFGKTGSLAKFLPKREHQEIKALPPLEQELKIDDLLFDVHGQIALWHVDQVKELLAELPDWEKRRCWSYLPVAVAEHLRLNEPSFDSASWPEPFAHHFFKTRFFQFFANAAPLPRGLLRKTPLDYLLSYSADEIAQFCSLMAIHSLMVPMKHMIEQEKRVLLKKAMTQGPNSATFITYLRHLQSDINEQTAPIAEIQFPLYRWDWQVESFSPLVSRFGLYCLAKLLTGHEASYLDHIALKLHPELAPLFRALNKGGLKKARDHTSLERNLQRLAAKASDFLLSPEHSKRDGLASPTAPPSS